MRVHSPRAIAGQPSCCARVGEANDDSNHSLTEGWNGSSAAAGFVVRAMVSSITLLDIPENDCKNSNQSPMQRLK